MEIGSVACNVHDIGNRGGYDVNIHSGRNHVASLQRDPRVRKDSFVTTDLEQRIRHKFGGSRELLADSKIVCGALTSWRGGSGESMVPEGLGSVEVLSCRIDNIVGGQGN